MDTITHGIAGALIGKAVFGGRDLFPARAMGKDRVITWALMLGAIFPDSDVFREFVSKNDLLMLTWHRSITHSLLCLPLWSALLAWITVAICRWRKWQAPPFVTLCGLYAIGILSHIFLDLVTTFGTMIWSPLEWSRPAWDILFIIDFTFAALLLIPQLLAWAYDVPAHYRKRALFMWLIFTPAPFLISRIARIVGAPISNLTVLVATLLFAVFFLLPAVQGWGLRVQYPVWNRVGLVLSCLYLLTAAAAHFVALQRVEKFAQNLNIQPQAVGALPLPPSLWHWDGLVRAPRGVYEYKMDLSEGLLQHGLFDPSYSDPNVLEHTYFPDAPPNHFIEEARNLQDVQKVLWFDRFPVTYFHTEGSEAVVEITDLRFARLRPDRTPSFTYQVRFAADGRVLFQGWRKP
jgi:membrane-bound metal-dependent hydrolase YbcI (DUF457 family)